MSDTLPLMRQWTLLRILASRRRGASVRDLAGELDVSEKTIRRDLLLLARLGFPLKEAKEEHGRKAWRLDGDNLLDLRFTFDELTALYLGRRLLEPLAGTLLWDGAQRAFRKIRSGLSEEALRHLEKLAAIICNTMIGASDYSDRGEMIDRLMLAIEDRKIAFLTYRSAAATEPVTYDVYPYGLVYHRGSLYLVAFAPQHDELRHYKVDRIEVVDVQNLQFKKPRDFDLKAHLQKAFGIFAQNGPPQRVELRFSPEVARYVEEKRWHPSQKLARQPDGSLLVEFTVTALEEVKSWVMSFGPNVEVVEPESLRTQIIADIAAMSTSYMNRANSQSQSSSRRRTSRQKSRHE